MTLVVSSRRIEGRKRVDRPVIALTMGDAAGVGPEIIAKVLAQGETRERCRPLVDGPCPADTVFVRARTGEFQGVVCMYHDQANIARKLLATRRGATIYLGLPVPCATTAHGTAYDIAGRGVAAPDSLADALRYTVSLAGETASAADAALLPC
jgi:4-hydroxythreonine-4-phosphate dehydrogenase